MQSARISTRLFAQKPREQITCFQQGLVEGLIRGLKKHDLGPKNMAQDYVQSSAEIQANYDANEGPRGIAV